MSGRYRPKAQAYEEDYEQAIQEDYYLVLNPGGGDSAQSVTTLETILRDLSAESYVFRNVFVL